MNKKCDASDIHSCGQKVVKGDELQCLSNGFCGYKNFVNGCTKDSDCNSTGSSFICRFGVCELKVMLPNDDIPRSICVDPPKSDAHAIPGTWDPNNNTCDCGSPLQEIDGETYVVAYNPYPQTVIDGSSYRQIQPELRSNICNYRPEIGGVAVSKTSFDRPVNDCAEMIGGDRGYCQRLKVNRQNANARDPFSLCNIKEYGSRRCYSVINHIAWTTPPDCTQSYKRLVTCQARGAPFVIRK